MTLRLARGCLGAVVLAIASLGLSAPSAIAAPLAAALGPEVAPAEAASGFIGKLQVAPAHAAAGATVTVTAEGLPPQQHFDLVWRTVKGSWKASNGEYHGRDYAPVGYRIATLTSDAAGKLAASFVAPDDFGFEHDIVLQQGKRLYIQTAFNLDMTVSMSPASGPVGTPITFDIHGIGWRELESSWMLVYDNGFTGWISAVTTHGAAHFTIPATGGPGLHVVRLIHGEFTFPYLNPQQNPVPDRPRFRMNFTLTDGAPVPPPPAAAQMETSVKRLPPPGALVATPAFAGVDQPIRISANGFTPGKTYPLEWTTVTGNRVAAGRWEKRARSIASAVADRDGRLTFQIRTPDDLGGAHDIYVEDGAKKVTGKLTIVPTALPLDPAEAPAGKTIRVHLKGVGWTETANIYHLVYDNAYLGYACGFNSQGDVTIDMPATGAPGWHFIDLYPGIYKGQETRPNNFRIPQLTYAADHPAEDLPAFHFAIHVTGNRIDHVEN